MQATAIEKKECPITRDEFRTHAKPITVTIDGQAFTADVKEFSTGSLGFSISQKLTLSIAGKPVRFQCGLNIAAIGSKDLPK